MEASDSHTLCKCAAARLKLIACVVLDLKLTQAVVLIIYNLKTSFYNDIIYLNKFIFYQYWWLICQYQLVVNMNCLVGF